MTANVLEAISELDVDVSRGLSLTGGDVDFYLELVAEFCAQVLENTTVLRGNLDISAISAKVHTLKGILLTLGESRIAAHAQRLENDLSNSHFEVEKLEELCRELQSLATALRAITTQ